MHVMIARCDVVSGKRRGRLYSDQSIRHHSHKFRDRNKLFVPWSASDCGRWSHAPSLSDALHQLCKKSSVISRSVVRLPTRNCTQTVYKRSETSNLRRE